MKLSELLKDVEYKVLRGSIDTEVKDIVYDSRKAAKGTAFVCLTGAEADGHNYIESAVKLGCSVVIVEKEVEYIDGVTYIFIENTRKALSYLAQAIFGYPAKKLTMIALTGTKGKTTTAFMIKAILEVSGKKVGVI